MQYYSDKTKKVYKTVDELNDAEKKYDDNQLAIAKRNDERKARAKEVEDAYKVMEDARKAYNKKVNDFIKDYGSYHYSITKKLDDDEYRDPLNLLDIFFKPFIWQQYKKVNKIVRQGSAILVPIFNTMEAEPGRFLGSPAKRSAVIPAVSFDYCGFRQKEG